MFLCGLALMTGLCNPTTSLFKESASEGGAVAELSRALLHSEEKINEKPKDPGFSPSTQVHLKIKESASEF